ncbi:MAG TPA: hypothetical protein DIW23_10050 [Anaerolineae bacterium]|nr:hypothetical protein [Anaerolineae bacterium]
MTYLRDFLYLDIAKLHSFVSQIQGGMISEISETIKQLGGLSAGINVGIPQLGGKVDASKQKESERQQSITLTDPAYFGVLHQYLKQEKNLVDITEISLDRLSALSAGQFIEMRGIAEPPLVENWIERVNTIFGFVERNLKTFSKLQGNSKGKPSSNFSNMEMRQFRTIIDTLIDYINLTRKDPGKLYVRTSSKDQSFKVWCGLLPDYSMINLQSALPAEIQLFGRVDHLVAESKVEKIVDLSVFDQALQVDKLLDVLNGFNKLSGQNSISETDLEAKYPDIFVTPVAIYQ